MKNSYWNNNGVYQKELDTMWNLIPHQGEVIFPQDKELELAIESIRGLNRLYYDFYNNGCCNVVEADKEDCYECGGTGYEENDDDEDWEDCSACGGDCTEVVGHEITHYYAEMIDSMEDFIHSSNFIIDESVYSFNKYDMIDKLQKVLISCGSRYGSYNFPIEDEMKLEALADCLIFNAWNIYKERSIEKHIDNLKTLLKRKDKKTSFEGLKEREIFLWAMNFNIGKQKVSYTLEEFEKFVKENNLDDQLKENTKRLNEMYERQLDGQ